MCCHGVVILECWRGYEEADGGDRVYRGLSRGDREYELGGKGTRSLQPLVWLVRGVKER